MRARGQVSAITIAISVELTPQTIALLAIAVTVWALMKSLVERRQLGGADLMRNRYSRGQRRTWHRISRRGVIRIQQRMHLQSLAVGRIICGDGVSFGIHLYMYLRRCSAGHVATRCRDHGCTLRCRHANTSRLMATTRVVSNSSGPCGLGWGWEWWWWETYVCFEAAAMFPSLVPSP